MNMSSKDIAHNIGVVQVVVPQVLAATDTSAAIDTAGFESAALIVETGAIVGAGDFTAKLQNSDTTTSGDFVDVTAANLIGTFPASLAASSVVKVGYIGNKRYLRSVITKNSGTSIAAGAVLVKGHPRSAPVA
jgi:hypothetical protein